MPSSSAPGPTPRTKLLALTLGILVSLGLAELVCQFILPASLAGDIFVDERNALYDFDGELGWFPVPNQERGFNRSRPILAKHNSQGFRDLEPVDDERPMLLFVGDSFVWGFDVNDSERFVSLLRSELKGWNVRNIGVSAYGTDQELMLLKKVGRQMAPEHVFLVYCTSTDRIDNSTNKTRFGYYKPYFELVSGKLEPRGRPVPRSVNWAHKLGVLRTSALLRFLMLFRSNHDQSRLQVPDPTHALIAEMDRYVREELGARFSIGITAPDPELSAFCDRTGLSCLDLSTNLRYHGFGRHWTPEGNRWVADRLLRHLAPQGGFR